MEFHKGVTEEFKMAAAIAKTLQKIYSTTNACCLCGFLFVVKEIDKDGNIQIKK